MFIDYGEEWDNAWAKHVAQWRSPCQGEDSARVLSSWVINNMNSDKFNSTLWNWSTDHFTVCKRDGSLVSKTIVISNDTTLATSGDGHPVSNNYEGITVDDEGFKHSSHDDLRMPCRVKKANMEKGTFEIVMFLDHLSSIEVHRKLPARNLNFIPKPYKSDMHLPGAFRHEIKIPDEIFPRHWMDVEEKKQK